MQYPTCVVMVKCVKAFVSCSIMPTQSEHCTERYTYRWCFVTVPHMYGGVIPRAPRIRACIRDADKVSAPLANLKEELGSEAPL